jgi:PAS domain S-box-containing protein
MTTVAPLPAASGQGLTADPASPGTQSGRPWLVWLIVGGILAVIIVALGGRYYHNRAAEYRAAAERELTALAQSKVSELASWRRERLSDAVFYSQNPGFAGLVDGFLRAPGQPGQRAALLAALGDTQNSHAYEITLLDADARPRLLLPETQPAASATELATVRASIRTGVITPVDLHALDVPDRLGFGFVSPISAPDNSTRIIGALVFRMNPADYLFPFLTKWPVPSATSECLLVRREGDEAVFLNPLRFAPDAALRIRIPLADTTRPVVQAVLGRTGIVRGLDYRGVPAIAAILPVPESSWFLVARMDEHEVAVPLRARLWEIVALTTALLFALGVGGALLRRRETLRSLRNQVRVADQLRASEERLRLALAATEQGLYDLNLQSGEVSVSPEYASMLGHDPATFRLTLKDWIEQLHPEDRPSARKVYADLLAGNVPDYRIEFRQRTRDGGWKWILSIGKVVSHSPDGRPVRMLGTHTDITARKNAEQHAQRLSRLYTVLSHCNQAIMRSTREADLFAQICRDAVQFGGLKLAWIGMVDPVSGRVIPVVVEGDGMAYIEGIQISVNPDDPLGKGPVGRAIRENRPVWCQNFQNDPVLKPWHERAARYGWGSCAAVPLNRSGRTVGCLTLYAELPDSFDADIRQLVVEMGRDVSFALDNFDRDAARRNADAQVRLIHTALDASPVGWMITNHEGIIEWVNAAFSTLTGYSVKEVVGQNPRILNSGLHPPEFYQEMWASLRRGDVWSGEVQNRRKDGTVYREHMTVAPARDPAGKLTYFVAMKQDITEKKHLELQVLRAQRMEGIGMLAGGIAHDLNNVLSPILLSIELLRMRFPGEAGESCIHSIESAARRGAGVVRQVLTFARGIEGERIPLRVKDVIREIASMIEETFPRSITVQRSLPADLPLVLADATQLHQVLLNLAVNARDAMPEGGTLTFQADRVSIQGTASPFATAAKPGDYLRISVRDTGQGIPPELIDRIFEPFFTTKAPGLGTGLGLATAFGIVRSHGGFLDVKSTLGVGTVFEVYLPAITAPAQPAAPAAAPDVPRGTGQTILVCDDEEFIRDISSEILTRAGYRVLCATGGAQAITLASDPAQPIALVIMDVMMPGLTGDLVALELRRLRPGLPVLFSTGMVSESGPEKSLREQLAQPHTGLLAKPYDDKTLRLAVHRLLTGQNVDLMPSIPH